MIGFKWLPLFVIACSPSLAIADQTPQKTEQKCDIGPVTRQYGGSVWLVYGCNDKKSLVFVTAPNSPATPFVFFYLYSQSRYHLYGEGNGNKKLTDSAFEDLKKLTPNQIDVLLTDTSNAVHK